MYAFIYIYINILSILTIEKKIKKSQIRVKVTIITDKVISKLSAIIITFIIRDTFL